jgi:hypothetical protein
MSDSIASDVESKDSVGQPAETPPWLRATAADLRDLDFESPIAGSTSADTSELSDQFQAAVQPADKTAQPPDTPTTRVLILLSAVTGMHFKPEERHEPFGPMFTFTDGRRSAIPSDFREGHVDLLPKWPSKPSTQYCGLGSPTFAGCWTEREGIWAALPLMLTQKLFRRRIVES